MKVVRHSQFLYYKLQNNLNLLGSSGRMFDFLLLVLGPETRLGDLPQDLTLRDLGVKEQNLPPGATLYTTLAELPDDMTLYELGFTEHDIPTVRDRVRRACQIRHGPIYESVLPEDLSKDTTLNELPQDLILRDFGLTEGELPDNVSLDDSVKQLPGNTTLESLGLKEKDMPVVKDTINRNYQLRHDIIYVNVIPENISPDTKVGELPKELTIKDLGLTVPEDVPDVSVSELHADTTLNEHGVSDDDISSLRESANRNYTLRHAPVYRNAIPYELTQDQKVRIVPYQTFAMSINDWLTIY